MPDFKILDREDQSRRLRPDNLSRLETLADGIFAIAMTLLVLEVKVPSESERIAAGGLISALAHGWPAYFAFVLSFTLISSYWVNHHALFRLLHRTDHRFTLLTLLLLATISFLPFPTAVLGHYLLDLNRSVERDAVVFYATGLLIASAAWTVGWHYAKGLADPALDPVFMHKLGVMQQVSVVMHVMAVLALLVRAAAWPYFRNCLGSLVSATDPSTCA